MRIPIEELYESSVDFPHPDIYGKQICTKILLHKRRVTPGALQGTEMVNVCNVCFKALHGSSPKPSKFCLANCNWLGRHSPLFRGAPLGHQLLLALGRVVSTKVYLSSKGVDEPSRQQHVTWRQKYLQTGIKGTAIVFENGNADDAMASFPPTTEVIQQTFVAVFTGPEKPTPSEEDIMRGSGTDEIKAQEEMARGALRREVELSVDRVVFQEQADALRKTNEVYNRARYCQDIVDQFPERGVPSCFEACAKFVPVVIEEDDVMKAQGPSTATTEGQRELDAAEEQDAVELVTWLSVVDEFTDETAELTALPALQGLLERMESQAGRVVANEVLALVQDSGVGAMDALGRTRLRNLCMDFHAQCLKASREEDLQNLQWRVQALATNKSATTNEATDGGSDTRQQRRVRTSRKAYTWWNPEYWTVARPTDFCYGDCVWGHERQTFSLSIAEWATMLMRREELEYDMPTDKEKFVAAPINRFRKCWYVLHLLYSFWRVSETTASIHTFLKTPGAFGYARAVVDITPEMLTDVMLKSQQAGGKPTVQGLLADKDLPKQVRTALTSLHQSTAGVVGSDGHRKLLQKEGVAYTLRFGPALVFLTPNLADNKQPLLLVVQGEEFCLDEHVEHTYRDMVQRMAADPVGQAIVFELMIRLFFTKVLGVRAGLIGRRRGAAQESAQQRFHDGFAADESAWSFLGPVAAAFGPIEAQGRGSLHPHILVWLVLISMQELLVTLMRDRANFKQLIGAWMVELVQAIVSVQHSAVTSLPQLMGAGTETPSSEVPPLPLGPNERRYFHGDGQRETATAVELGRNDGEEDQELFYYCPDRPDDNDRSQFF